MDWSSIESLTTTVRNLKVAVIGLPFLVAALGVWLFLAQSRLDRLKDARNKETEQALKTELAAAQSEIGSARQDAAAAKEHASTARTEAADAKREAADMAERVRPRVLSDEQRRKFLESAGLGKKGVVLVVASSPEIEIERFARQLMELIAEAGWTIPEGGLRRMLGGTAVSGVFLLIRDPKSAPPHLKALERALKAAAVPFKTEVNPGISAGGLQVLVGSK